MKSNNIEFTGALGDNLSARLDRAEGDEIGFALFAHCFTCSKNLKAVGHITKSLADRGISTLRFDFTGLGQSDGEFANTNFSSNVQDLVAAADYMETNLEAPALLVGHSLGGAAVLHAAHNLDSVKAVATIGAPSDPTHVKENFSLKLDEIEETGEADVTLAGRSFRIKKQFLDDLEEAGRKDKISTLNRALLIMHAPLDSTVNIDNAATLYARAKHPKSFVSLYQSDHLLTDPVFSKYAGKLIAQWSEIYI
ncbi:alpha/beta hydrolase family protein [Rhodohalobacter sp. 8-1]|uniref:alpha/beta hydrolase family protein n=1 Tax=Rhodohalobacter sp. 8-1 TaxID=3131972 RepID=UPI0030EC21A6